MLKGLPPIIGNQPRILILGSMPSGASIEKQQYYGHPRNAFWTILAQLASFELSNNYDSNVKNAQQCGIAIWDVIAKCERKGSLDSAIIKGSEVLNSIESLLLEYPSIKRIGLNGGLAASLFHKHFKRQALKDQHAIHKLPSTSPANARMSPEEKAAAWKPLFVIEP